MYVRTHVWCKKFGIKVLVFISANTPILFLDTNHWVDTSFGGLWVPDGVIRTVVSPYVLTWFNRYIYDEIKQITTWRALKNDQQSSDHNIIIDACSTASEQYSIYIHHDSLDKINRVGKRWHCHRRMNELQQFILSFLHKRVIISWYMQR